MNRENLPAERRTLEEVNNEFRSWRNSRKRGTKIPQQLWQAAAGLSEQHSIGKIAVTLGLDYTTLKQRITYLPSFQTRRVAEEFIPDRAGSGFVEVDMVAGGSTGECTIEAEDGIGRKLRMHLRGSSFAEAVEIAKAFWESGG